MDTHLLQLKHLREQIEDLPADMTLGQWLTAMNALQEVGYGLVLEDMDNEQRADYMTQMRAALDDEVAEMSQEMGWKSWSHPRGWVNCLPAIQEGADAMHFLAHLLNIAEADGETLGYELKKKMLRNIDRQLEGYDTRTSKCTRCGRALEDFGPPVEVLEDLWCQVCFTEDTTRQSLTDAEIQGEAMHRGSQWS